MTDILESAPTTRGPLSLCNVLDSYYERALRLDLAEETSLEYTSDPFVSTETYEDRLADCFSVVVDKEIDFTKQLHVYIIEPDEKPLQIIEHFNKFPLSFTPMYIVCRSIRGVLNADFGINNDEFVLLEKDHRGSVIGFSFDRGIKLTQLARELIDGEPVRIESS